LVKTGDPIVDGIFEAVAKMQFPASEKISALARAAAIAQPYTYETEELKESVLGLSPRDVLQH
jgi:hypothetical protein